VMLFFQFQNAIANRDERGAAMAEYGLLLALVALAAIFVLAAADTRLQECVADAGGSSE
jgi:Flp pilus assembly pilin Flp